MVVPILAHALPQSVGAVPLTLVIAGLLGAFLAVNALGTRRAAALVGGPRPEALEPTARVPAVLAAPGVLVGWTLFVLTLGLSIFGPADPATNLTDVVVLTLGWGAVALSSLVVGGWWPAVDPVSAVSRTLERVAGPSVPRHLPGWLATSAMAVTMVAWAAAQLLVDSTPLGFGIVVLVYVALNVVLAGVYGSTWLDQVESVTVMSKALGLLRPGDGGPAARLSAVADTDHLRWFSSILIGWSLTDLILETEWWHDLAVSSDTAGPALLIGSIVATYGLVRAASSRASLGPAFVAVAAGWVVAHYLSILLIDGQGITIWLTDPFGTGADYLGRRGDLINLEPLPIPIISALQLLPFLAGHVLAVVVTQRRAAARVSSASTIGPATFFARAVIAMFLLGGAYLQLGGL